MSGGFHKVVTPAFTVDFRVPIMMEFSLTQELADLILASGTDNTALWAFAKKLKDGESET